MTVQHQLERWVAGESLHNPTRNECCPDFSCCRPELKAPKRTRQRFAKAHADHDEKTRNSMLVGFLGKSLRLMGHRVTTSADVIREARRA